MLWRKTGFCLILFLVISISLTGCGEPPPPTPTPTPIPYNIDVSVMDAEGNPMSGALVAYKTSKFETDASGQVSIPNESPTVKLTVSAPGYFTTEVNPTLQQGSTTVEVSLAQDPNGLLPMNACRSDEELVYIQDFQAGESTEWQPDGPSQGWTVEADPANSNDLALVTRGDSTWSWLGGRNGYELDNSVWRIWFKMEGNPNLHFNYRFTESILNGTRYFLAVNPNGTNLVRYQNEQHMDLAGGSGLTSDSWHLLEFSYYEGNLQVWIDHQQVNSYDETAPWPGGTVNLEPYAGAGNAIYFDDVSLCKLNGPFETIPRPVTGYDLTVNAVDAEGLPVAYTSATVVELGTDSLATQLSDESGAVSWEDLPADTATVQVSAPGYVAQEITQTIEKDTPAEVSVTLERDEAGMLASVACGPNEKLLYVDDIQDSNLQGWNSLMNSIKFNVPGWTIVPDPEDEANVILVSEFAGAQHAQPQSYEGVDYGDAVLRFWTQMFSDSHLIVGWHRNDQPFIAGETPYQYGGYMSFIYAFNGGRVERFGKPEGGQEFYLQTIGWSYGYNGDGKWHQFEISTYQGELQIWRDGKLLGKWTDPEPFDSGYFSVEMDFWNPQGKIYLDDFSVCGLEAAFESNYQGPK